MPLISTISMALTSSASGPAASIGRTKFPLAKNSSSRSPSHTAASATPSASCSGISTGGSHLPLPLHIPCWTAGSLSASTRSSPSAPKPTRPSSSARCSIQSISSAPPISPLFTSMRSKTGCIATLQTHRAASLHRARCPRSLVVSPACWHPSSPTLRMRPGSMPPSPREAFMNRISPPRIQHSLPASPARTLSVSSRSKRPCKPPSKRRSRQRNSPATTRPPSS